MATQEEIENVEVEEDEEDEEDEEIKEESATGNMTLDMILWTTQDHAFAAIIAYLEIARRNADLAETVLAYAHGRVKRYCDGAGYSRLITERHDGVDEVQTEVWLAFIDGMKAAKDQA